MMTPHHVELASSERNALCMLFVDGRLAAACRGSAVAPVRAGQQIRWFIRARRPNATFALTERRGVREAVVASGCCEAPLTTGVHEAVRPPRRRRGMATLARGGRQQQPRQAAAQLPHG